MNRSNYIGKILICIAYIVFLIFVIVNAISIIFTPKWQMIILNSYPTIERKIGMYAIASFLIAELHIYFGKSDNLSIWLKFLFAITIIAITMDWIYFFIE